MQTTRLTRMLVNFWAEQDGVTSIEYALLAALIFGAIVVSVGLLGDSVEALYEDIAQKVTDAVP